MGLHADVLGGIAAADHEQVLAGKALCAAEVVGVHDLAREGFDALEFGDVGDGEVAGGDDQLVEDVGFAFPGFQVLVEA